MPAPAVPRLVALLVVLLVPVGALSVAGALPAAEPPAGNPLWIASDAVTSLKLNPYLLEDLGIEVVGWDPTAPAEREGYTGFAATDASALAFFAPGADVERVEAGTLRHRGGLSLLLPDGGGVLSLHGFELRPAARGPMTFDLLDAAGDRWFEVGYVHALLDPAAGELLVLNTDVEISPELAKRLGRPELAGQYAGTLDVRLAVEIPPGADLAGACDQDDVSPKDVQLIGLDDVDQLVREAGGRVAVALSAELKNVNEGTVPWFRAIAPDGQVGQHPFLSMAVYRIRGGVIEMIGQGDVKHAFFALNNACPCAGGQLLYKDCEDVYGVSTNADRFQLALRHEVTAGTGGWESLGSHFDATPVDDFRHHFGDSDHDAFEHRVLIQEPDLQTTDSEYFAEAWYVVQDDINIFNSMGYRQMDPNLSGSVWDFPFVGSLVNAPAIDAWVDPGAPPQGAGNTTLDTGEGTLKLAVRTLTGITTTHYEYALLNLDFDRQIDSFSVPLPAGVTASKPGFGDIDDDPGNDWSVSIDSAAVTWTAPPGNALDWGTLYNFRFDATAAAADGLALLGTLEAGSVGELAAITKVPAGESGIPCADVESFVARCRAVAQGNRIQARVILTDTSHDGESVTLSVDGAPSTVPIVGRRATFQQAGAATGQHTVALDDPAGCFPAVVVNCP